MAKKEKHYRLTEHFDVRLVPRSFDGQSGYDWYVYKGPHWKGQAVASSSVFGSVQKAIEDAKQGLAIYLSK
jgi:hypothetical protein